MPIMIPSRLALAIAFYPGIFYKNKYVRCFMRSFDSLEYKIMLNTMLNAYSLKHSTGCKNKPTITLSGHQQCEFSALPYRPNLGHG